MSSNSANNYYFPKNVLATRNRPTDAGHLEQIARTIKSTLIEMGFDTDMESADIGSIFTRYTAKCHTNIYTKLSAVEDELRKRLSVESVISYRLPNEKIAIEIPNKKIGFVSLGHILEKTALPRHSFVAGVEIDGSPFIINLDQIDCMLVTGYNSGGLPSFIDSVLMSLIYGNNPESLNIVLLDSRAWLEEYAYMPHVIRYKYNPEEQIETLKWVVDELESRIETMTKAKVKNFEAYNKKFEKDQLPRIVIVISEISAQYDDFEQLLVSLSRKRCKLAGIHVIYTTIRPQMVSNLLKANTKTMAIFNIADKENSQHLLDSNEATKLLKNQNDFLLVSRPHRSGPRLSVAKVQDYEIEEISSIFHLNDIDYENIAAISISENGAMGNPGAITILERDFAKHHFHHHNVDFEYLKDKLPVFRNIHLEYGNIIGLDNEWEYYYFGYGNYLLIKKEMFDDVKKILENEKSNGTTSAEIYHNWTNIVQKATSINWLDDAIIQKALEITAAKGKWSTAMLQTYLEKGHGYMASLTIWAEENNLIGPSNGNRPRPIYFTSVSDAINIVKGIKESPKYTHLSLKQLNSMKMLLTVNPSASLNTAKYLRHLETCTFGIGWQTEKRIFVESCIVLLKEYYILLYKSNFEPPYHPYPFNKFIYEKLFKECYNRKLSLHLFASLKKIAYDNFEILDIEQVFMQLMSDDKCSKLKALYFIEKIGPEKALTAINQIFDYEKLEDQNNLLDKLDLVTDHLITDEYRRFRIRNARCADIENRPSFVWQFRHLSLLNFNDSDHSKIIEKISKYTTKQLARNAEQISLYFFNYIFQLDKLPLKKIFDSAIHVFKNLPIEGNNSDNLRMLYCSTLFIIAYSLKYDFCLAKYNGDYSELIYDVFYPKVGNVWPIKNRKRLSFVNEIDEEIFNLSAKMIGYDFDIERHDLEFANFLKNTIVFDEPFEDYWFISFLMRNSDLGLHSDAMLNKIICEISCDEIVPKDELMDKLCLLFASNHGGMKLLDEIYRKNSPLRQFKNTFFEKLLDYADEDTFDSILISILNNFGLIEEICNENDIYRIFIQACCSSYKIADRSLLKDFADLLSKKDLISEENITKALKAAQKCIDTHELQNEINE